MSYNYCILYVAGLLVVYAYDDISFNKIATQSHTYAGVGYGATNAVDGNIATCMRTKQIGRTSPDKTVWWKVDFGEIINVYRINILFKNYDGFDIRQRGRFAGFSLFVSKTGDIQGATFCYKNGLQLPPLNFTSICTTLGRYVIFYNERLDGVSYPDGYEVINVHTELCEVTVQGCGNASFYGTNCETPCPTNCRDSTCHIHSGSCFKCKPGWTGMYCNTKCKKGWYGDNCTQRCVGHCRDGISCNHVTGQCDEGCDAGWTGYMCYNECDDRTYGHNCVNNCSGHCLSNSPCNKITGHCDMGCSPGYTHSDCRKECLPGYFGLDCSIHCSGHCLNNEPCDHISGECPSGCQDGFVGTRCSNVCKEGYYGRNCARECSQNCRLDTCRHTDGSCSCASGWTGDNCSTECLLSYGDNCQHPCSELCINQTCDRINGSCLYGCGKDKCDTDTVKYTRFSPDNFAITFGGLVCACVLIIIGVVITIFVIRQKSSTTVCNRSVNRFCLRSTPAAEESVNSEGLSNYQELNFALQENPYQSMSR